MSNPIWDYLLNAKEWFISDEWARRIMSERNRYKAEFENSYCDSETEQAIHVLFENHEGIVCQRWVPKSLVDDDSEVYKQGDEGTLVLPEWFALKEGLI